MKEQMLKYTVLFTPDEESGGFTVEVPSLPGCHTYGNTFADAKANAQEAIELYLETLIERGFQPPEDTEPNFFTSKVEIKLRPHFA